MKKFTFLLTLFLALPVFSQQSKGFKGSEIFFYNENIGAIIKGNGTIISTSNGAANWNAANLPGNKIPTNILFVSEFDAWAISDNGVFYSPDGGISWTESETFPSDQLNSIYFFNENLGFIGGTTASQEATIFLTKDGGASWERASFDVVTYSSIRSVSFANETIGFAVSGTNAFKTIDGGTNWRELPLEVITGSGGLESCTAFDENTVLFTAWQPDIVAEGYLILSPDGGETWEENPYRFNWGFSDSYFYDVNYFWLATIDNVFYSNDAGNSWYAYRARCDKFSFFAKYKAYGLFGGNLIYTEDGWSSYIVVDSTLTGIDDETSQPEEFKLYQNYPNPFGKSSYSGSQSTTIAFELPSEDVVKINIYNSIGEIVRSVKETGYSAGRHEYIFNAGNLPSGVYLYQIQTKKFHATKKFVFLK